MTPEDCRAWVVLVELARRGRLAADDCPRWLEPFLVRADLADVRAKFLVRTKAGWWKRAPTALAALGVLRQMPLFPRSPEALLADVLAVKEPVKPPRGRR